MNWNHINETAPKAFRKWFTQYIAHPVFPTEPAIASFLNCEHKEVEWQITLRDLYDFFDSHKLWIEVSVAIPNQRHIEPVRPESEFWFSVVTTPLCYTSDDFYPSRQEAETAAFTRAFSLLEQQLTA